MAQKTKVILFFALLIIIFQACKKNEALDGPIYPQSRFSYLEKDYSLSDGFLIHYGKFGEDEGYSINLNLISSGIKIYDKKGVIDSAAGFGHLLFFEMFSHGSKQLVSGSYLFDSLYTGRAGTFDSGKGFLNMELPAKTSQTFQISSGKMYVNNKENGKYEIDFDCKNIHGQSIKGNFIGDLKYYDYQ